MLRHHVAVWGFLGFLLSGVGQAVESPPLERRFIEFIVNGHKWPLEPQMHPGCTNMGLTVGDYFSSLMTDYLFADDPEKKLTIKCESFDASRSPFKAPKKNESPMECVLDVQWKSASGVEKKGFTARITRNGRGLERKYLACR